MELRHLRCFLIVAEELHFARAAERLHIDQSPLSRTIKELEEELGARLFIRTTRSTQLTRAGRQLLEHVPRIFTAFPRSTRSPSTRSLPCIGSTSPISSGCARSVLATSPGCTSKRFRHDSCCAGGSRSHSPAACRFRYTSSPGRTALDSASRSYSRSAASC